MVVPKLRNIGNNVMHFFIVFEVDDDWIVYQRPGWREINNNINMMRFFGRQRHNGGKTFLLSVISFKEICVKIVFEAMSMLI